MVNICYMVKLLLVIYGYYGWLVVNILLIMVNDDGCYMVNDG